MKKFVGILGMIVFIVFANTAVGEVVIKEVALEWQDVAHLDGGTVFRNEVLAMAIEYAEVSPEKIKRWRKGAKFKALFPKVSFGIDEGRSDTYEIYTTYALYSILDYYIHLFYRF